MSDNKFYLAVWISIFVFILIFSKLIIQYFERCDDKVISIQRYQIDLRLPNGRKPFYVVDFKEMEE